MAHHPGSPIKKVGPSGKRKPPARGETGRQPRAEHLLSPGIIETAADPAKVSQTAATAPLRRGFSFRDIGRTYSLRTSFASPRPTIVDRNMAIDQAFTVCKTEEGKLQASENALSESQNRSRERIQTGRAMAMSKPDVTAPHSVRPGRILSLPHDPTQARKPWRLRGSARHPRLPDEDCRQRQKKRPRRSGAECSIAVHGSNAVYLLSPFALPCCGVRSAGWPLVSLRGSCLAAGC